MPWLPVLALALLTAASCSHGAPTRDRAAGTAPAGAARPLGATDLSPAVLDLAAAVVRAAPGVDSIWEGLGAWTREFMIDLRGEGQILFVGVSPREGMEPVLQDGLPDELRDNLWRTWRVSDDPVFDGLPPHLSLLRFEMPYARIHALPRGQPPITLQEDVLRQLYDDAIFDVRPEWRDRLLQYPRIKQVGWACPTDEPRSCVAVELLARRLLRRALLSSDADLPALLEQYASVKFVQLANSERPKATVAVERNLGVHRRTTRLAVARALELDTAGYTASVHDELVAGDSLIVASRVSRVPVRRDASGEAELVLLERLGVDWKLRIFRGYSLFELLVRSLEGFDPQRAPIVVEQAKSAFGYDSIMASIPVLEEDRAGKTRPDLDVDIDYYARGVAAALGIAHPYVLNVPLAWRDDSTRFSFEVVEGPTGVLRRTPGNFVAIRAARVTIRTPSVDIVLRDHPVAAGRSRKSPLEIYRILLFLPDSVTDRIRPEGAVDIGGSLLRFVSPAMDIDIRKADRSPAGSRAPPRT